MFINGLGWKEKIKQMLLITIKKFLIHINWHRLKLSWTRQPTHVRQQNYLLYNSPEPVFDNISYQGPLMLNIFSNFESLPSIFFASREFRSARNHTHPSAINQCTRIATENKPRKEERVHKQAHAGKAGTDKVQKIWTKILISSFQK